MHPAAPGSRPRFPSRGGKEFLFFQLPHKSPGPRDTGLTWLIHATSNQCQGQERGLDPGGVSVSGGVSTLPGPREQREGAPLEDAGCGYAKGGRRQGRGSI